MSDEIELEYDDSQRTAVLTFSNGRKLRISNVTEQQAQAFRERHAREFARRDCVLHTSGTVQTRSGR